jgi:hypothetical protein
MGMTSDGIEVLPSRSTFPKVNGVDMEVTARGSNGSTY